MFGLWKKTKDHYVYRGREGEIIPADVTRVKVHPSVGAVKGWAFSELRQLRIVILNDGLEEIGGYAFYFCRSLQEIIIPNAVRAIKICAFDGCWGLTTVTLGNGGICIFELRIDR